MISGQSASPMSCTAVTSIPQSKWKSAGKDWLPLPSSCHGRKPQKTRSCRQRLGVRRTAFTCPTCSSIFRNVLHIQRCKQIWNSSWARNKFRGQMAAGISNSMWEADETNRPVPPQAQEESQLFQTGPLPGDLAEVEAFCQIFRVAERLYAAIMDTLCNPDTEECGVTHILEPVNFMSGDVPELEEKVVAALGCMAALLHRGRQQVLAGRSTNMNLFRVSDANVVDDKLPPLAIFRAEMKTCCEKLQSALECYFPPQEKRSTDIWRRLQQLKNVCYDAGFPRGEGSPCHTVLPNWAAVSLHPGESERMISDEQVAFWRGGQVTEEGLAWLLDNGYKTIVDLRAEGSNEKNCLAVIKKAVSSGRIRLVRFPVQVGNAPTREQVEKFATLVSNHESRPLYLHSQEGVWRTSAMVSRWRELVLNISSQVGSDRMAKGFGILPIDGQSLEKDTDGKVFTTALELRDSKLEDGLRSLNSGNGSVWKVQGSNHDLHKHTEMKSSPCSDFITDKHGMKTVAHVIDANEDQKSKRGRDEGLGDICPQESVWSNNPFEAQRPTCNVLSKKEMHDFLKNRKISPKTFIDHGIKRSRVSPISSKSDSWESVQKCEIAEAAGHWGMMVQPGVIRETSSSEDLGPASMGGISLNEQAHNYQNPVSLDAGRNGTVKIADESNKSRVPKSETSSIEDGGLSDGNGHSSDEEIQNGTFVRPSLASSPDDSDDSEPINGNMCASTTGVVRVQSRKKAEMYLVRTDGFSCTRERVRESSLAFTHPSTQQQMLMWKTPPKTVLLLKKLGKELMEEAQEVASFLYHRERMNVVVEPEVHDTFARLPGFGFVQTFYIQDTRDLHERVDFVACLGGDGVILHASNLFQGAVPPVVSFNLGSLGFLTAHRFADYKLDLRAIIHGNTLTDGVYITLRMRLRCEILRNGEAMPGKVYSVLNEVVVDRGSNPYLCKIECYEHNNLITKVQADGIIVATPTGSTAYSTSAGGSMVHPNVPCMLFTPICPHSLSFRPVILPDSAKLELKIPDDARSNAWVSFDGQRRQQLSKGNSVRICMSEHPLPTVNKCDQTGDWFRSLVRCLNWNERLEQKALIA